MDLGGNGPKQCKYFEMSPRITKSTVQNSASSAEPLVTELADLIDLSVAWKRFKADLPHRVFLCHPYELAVVESDLENWIEELIGEVRANRYRPRPLVVCDVPKGGGVVRPGTHFRVADGVMYAACLGACFPYIHKALSWSQGCLDFSYLLSKSPNEIEWIHGGFEGWRNFQKCTIDAIDQGASHVVFTDIAAYYENVDLSTLMSDLRQTGSPDTVVLQLSNCLNRWAQAPSRGVPQGHAPSDILAKLYLNVVDENLRSQGFTHLRYVDDFRIFCREESEAKKAILALTWLLRKRGLNLQTAKTQILTAEDARNKVNGIASKVLEIKAQWFVRLEHAFEAGDPYIFEEFSQEIRNDDITDPDSTPVEILRDAYATYFLPYQGTPFTIERTDGGVENQGFDKTLFHFLLSRMGKAKDEYASRHCLSLLGIHPEETRPICKYLEQVGRISTSDNVIVEFLGSAYAVYPYQICQLVEWRLIDNTPPIHGLLEIVRHKAFNDAEPYYLRSICRKFLGQFGTAADLERLEHSYLVARDDLEQCETLCNLMRMEKRRRNTFLGRFEQDSPLHRRTVAYVKAGCP